MGNTVAGSGKSSSLAVRGGGSSDKGVFVCSINTVACVCSINTVACVCSINSVACVCSQVEHICTVHTSEQLSFGFAVSYKYLYRVCKEKHTQIHR